MNCYIYAASICLSNDVPIETQSKILGHHGIRTTHIYAIGWNRWSASYVAAAGAFRDD